MNILFYVGEQAVSYAFPQVGVALNTVRYARTAYNIFKAATSIVSGDLVSGGATLTSMAVSILGGPSIGPGIPGRGISAKYIQCINECYRSCGETWTLTMCIAGCERFK